MMHVRIYYLLSKRKNHLSEWPPVLEEMTDSITMYVTDDIGDYLLHGGRMPFCFETWLDLFARIAGYTDAVVLNACFV